MCTSWKLRQEHVRFIRAIKKSEHTFASASIIYANGTHFLSAYENKEVGSYLWGGYKQASGYMRGVFLCWSVRVVTQNTGVLSNGCQCVFCGRDKLLLPFICHFLAWSSWEVDFSSNDFQVTTWSHCMQLARDSYLSATRRYLKAFLLQSFSNSVSMLGWGWGDKITPPIHHKSTFWRL